MNKVKTLLVLIIITALIGTGTAYARPGFKEHPGEGKAQYQQNDQNKNQKKAFKQKAKGQMSVIKTNELETNHLKIRIKQKSKKLQKEIRQLRKNRIPLNKKQLESVIKTTTIVQQNSTSLSSRKLSVGQEMARLRGYKKSGNYEGYIQEMEKITAIQQQRNKLLRETLQQLEHLENSLINTP